MTEPIKLPSFSDELRDALRFCPLLTSCIEAYARLAVEQATADLRRERDEARAELADRKAMLDSVQKLWGLDCEQLREARAKLARLTTLRMGPRGCVVCGVGKHGEAMGYVCPRMDCPTKVTCGWTPLPEPKEADK